MPRREDAEHADTERACSSGAWRYLVVVAPEARPFLRLHLLRDAAVRLIRCLTKKGRGASSAPACEQERIRDYGQKQKLSMS